jgi:hypothetical protein
MFARREGCERSGAGRHVASLDLAELRESFALFDKMELLDELLH